MGASFQGHFWKDIQTVEEATLLATIKAEFVNKKALFSLDNIKTI